MTKYEFLAKQLKERIETGVYRKGERLPTENELAKSYDISRHTVRQALVKLEFEGLIESIRGSGTFVKDTIPGKKSTMRIAVIVRQINDYIYPEILNGLQNEIYKNGYTMLLYSTDNHVDKERRSLLECMKQGVDGIIVEGTRSARPNPSLDLYSKIQKMGIPLVFIDTYYDGMQEPVCVGMDDYNGTVRLTKYLQDKGRRRIAGFFKDDTKVGHIRYKAFVDQEIAFGNVIEDSSTFWYATENQEQIIESIPISVIKNFDAAICYNDLIADRLVRKALNNGIRVPQDLAVVSFDNSILSETAPVKVTTMNHPKQEMGRIAAEKLINIINNVPEKSVQIVWDLIEKESC